MAVEVLDGIVGGGERRACLVCSQTDSAFGPLFDDYHEADAFLRYVSDELGVDVRRVPNLHRLLHDWRNAAAKTLPPEAAQ